LQTIGLATLPLLLAGLYLAADRGTTAMFLLAGLWATVVVVLTLAIWRTTMSPHRVLLKELGAASNEDARWVLRDVRDNAALCRSDRDRMSHLLEDLSQGLGEGLVVLDSDLRTRLVSPVACRFCGVERVAPETHLLEIVREPKIVEIFQTAAEGGQPRSVVVENPRGLWEVRAFPVRDGGAVGLMSDVSVTRRASEFRRRFVQDLSHEIRSPLAVMRTTVETLEGEFSGEFGEVLVRQVERIDRLTQELYELASIEAGHVELDLAAVKVAPVVREVVTDFRPEFARAEVELQTEVSDGIVCWCDRRGLYRVLSNLVDNAIKYNRREGWVRIRASEAPDQTVIEVADSGEGIPAGELQAVTQRFYRIERARTPGEGGLGLGLAIVKHMVQHMGGTLALDSREGVGTTVTLGFPDRDRGGIVRIDDHR
jgi:signal transduction histidine kinase